LFIDAKNLKRIHNCYKQYNANILLIFIVRNISITRLHLLCVEENIVAKCELPVW